jgi:translation initiation factor 5B
MPRQPILSVLGHVDSGKTTLLDKIRESRITEGEAGGITQMIGATEVPIETVDEVCGDLLNQLETDLTIPGILFIDTPGHAAFSSLRKRGGSISDIAILVVDISEGVQPQTEEAINILKESGTPFVVALNKIDTLNGWKSEDKIFTKNIQNQTDRNQEKLDNEIYELMGELNEYDIVADRFDRVDDFQKKVAMVPTSAETGEGIPELLMVVAGLSQRYLGDELEVEEGIGKGTVLEVSQEKGLGTTIDVIHYDGIIKKADTLVYGTAEGAKTTDIRAILEPRPLQEIRADKQYQDVDNVEPASGIKITGKDLEGAISGAPIRIASQEQVDEAIEQVEEELELREFETQNEGIVVKADSLGSLEAVMREIEDKDIPVRKADVGPINKSDVVEVQNEEPENKAIIAFNVGRTVSGEQAIKNEEVKVFQSNIIYEIVDSYQEWKEVLQEEAREEALNSISRPAKIRSMPEHVFRSSNPVVAGFKVVDGVLTSGSRLMTLDGEPVGRVKSVQKQNEKVEKAQKGDQVAVSISGATLGRTFEEGDELIVDVGKEEYQKLQELDDLLSAGEKKVLEEIVEIKDSIDPHWKIG